MADAIGDDVLDTEIPAGDAELPAEDLNQAPEGDEDEVVVEFEGEGAPARSEEPDSSVIRQLREENRKKDAELKALRAAQAPRPQVIEVGEKPTLASCEYEEERYEAELDAWKDRSAKAKEAETQAQRDRDAQQQTWTARVSEVDAQVAALGVKDFPDALEEVKRIFDESQQTVLILAPKDSAKLIYALGRNPGKAAELAKIKNPVVFAAELARLEGKVTVTQRKAPPPEQIVRGSAPLSAPVDKHLERLEAEAARTGDRSKVIQYKRELKAKARS